jgi:hypothetical protein
MYSSSRNLSDGVAQFVNIMRYTSWKTGQGHGFFSLRHRVRTGTVANPVSYPMDIVVCYTGDKVAGA